MTENSHFMFEEEDMLPADLPEVLEIERASFTNPWSEGMFMVEMALSHSRMKVLRTSPEETGGCGRLAGYICSWHVAGEAHILDIAVRQDCRRKGAARMLVRSLIDDSVRLGGIKVYLEVRVSNAPARAFYRNMGFIESGLRKKYYKEPAEDAVLMTLDLGAS